MTSKIYLAVIAASIATIGSASAAQISGTISFNGNVTAYVNNTATGATDYNFGNDHSLKFSGTVVTTPAPTLAFSGIAVGSAVSMYSPLLINQPGVTAPPAGTPLWSVGTFQFFVDPGALTQSLGTPNGLTDTMSISGFGTVHDTSLALSDAYGSWTATFTSGNSGGVTFQWGSSYATGTPETGTSIMMLGLGLGAMAAFGQFRKQVD